ncbi:MAG TPA: SAVED domain-containing protein [Methanosarcina sp.]|nr:SAVED domain-containing protein [Methanosarcina sp.]
MKIRLWLKNFIRDKEVLLSVGIFGGCSMFADLLSDRGNNDCAATVRSAGLLILILVIISDLVLKRSNNPFLIPVVFTEKDKFTSRNIFDKFVQSNKKLKDAPKVLDEVSKLKLDDLIFNLDNYNPRGSAQSKYWISSWRELLREWEIIDRELMGKPFSDEGFCYHIYPNLTLPLAFALGASVNLRRPLVLYHYQNQEFYKAIDLKDPHEVGHKPKSAVTAPKTIPEDLNLDGGKKLILHIVISALRVENFQLHEDYLNATNVAIVYNTNLDPKEDWLPYVQEIVQIAKPLIHRYEDVDVCLICPSAVAFALGMAFSRRGSLKVCDWYRKAKYIPVFPLSEIESHLPFS